MEENLQDSIQQPQPAPQPQPIPQPAPQPQPQPQPIPQPAPQPQPIPQPAPQPMPRPQATAPKPQKKKKKTWLIVLIIILAVLFLGFILLIGGIIAAVKLAPAWKNSKEAQTAYEKAVEYYNEQDYSMASNYITLAYEDKPDKEEYQDLYVDIYLDWGECESEPDTEEAWSTAIHTYEMGKAIYDDGRLEDACDEANEILDEMVAEREASEDAEREASEEAERLAEEEAAAAAATQPVTVNNGSEVVEYDGQIYRRRYSDECFQDEALWGDFLYTHGTSHMTQVMGDYYSYDLFEDKGYGDFFIYKGIMYSQYLDDEDMNHLYCCSIEDGSNFTEIADGIIVACDDATGQIYYTCYDPENTLYCYNCDSKEITTVDGLIGTVFSIENSNLYYYTWGSDSNWDNTYVVKKCSVTDNKVTELARVNEDSINYEYDPDYMELKYLTVIGSKVYFYYGGVSGTALSTDGGKIFCVDEDDLELVDLLDDEMLAMPEFYVQACDEGNEIYFATADSFDKMVIGTDGKCTKDKSGIFYQPIGVPFKDEEGNILEYTSSDGEQTLLVSVEALANTVYDKYDVDDNGETTVTVNHYEIIGSRVFFTVMAGEHNPAEDIGWRMSYTRAALYNYCLNQDSDIIITFE